LFLASTVSTRVGRRRFGVALIRAALALALLGCTHGAALSAEPDPATSAGEPLPPVAKTPGVDVALVLPLESAAYGRAAAAVRAGFVAAADDAKVPVIVVNHPDGDPVAGFAAAKEQGAKVVVGPLVRDDLRALAGSGVELPVTIALNQMDDGIPLPEHLYSLSLSIDNEGRQLARIVHASGARSVGVITARDALQRRFASAFVDEWLALGAGPPETFRFDRAPEALTALRKDLGRSATLDAVLLAVDGADVALLKSFVGIVSCFTSSQVSDSGRTQMRRDLDGVYFLELPWLVEGASPEQGRLPRGNYSNAALQRLYALGIDAFRVARMFVDGAPATLELDGATGYLRLTSSRLFMRESALMRFRAGAAEPSPPPRAVTPPP
jgi:outer membrane PBP1 activator LpoA protein